jgi:chemotaxis protein methyltransferase CheR
MNFESTAPAIFEQRRGERVGRRGLRSFLDYYHFISSGPQAEAEVDEALSLLTSGETYFFRHGEQLEALQQWVFPELQRRFTEGQRLRIWSAGCASGEEVYTLAILLAESELFWGWDLRVIGSDVCKSRILTARRGLYPSSAFRTTERWLRKRYFQEVGSEWQIADSIKDRCEFATINLCNASETALVGRVHAVLCRNVLIYLDERSRESLVGNLYERLLPGGFLLLGHSESLANQRTGFELVSQAHDTVYQKPSLNRSREVNR